MCVKKGICGLIDSNLSVIIDSQARSSGFRHALASGGYPPCRQGSALLIIEKVSHIPLLSQHDCKPDNGGTCLIYGIEDRFRFTLISVITLEVFSDRKPKRLPSRGIFFAPPEFHPWRTGHSFFSICRISAFM